jgi:hypothetical protein
MCCAGPSDSRNHSNWCELDTYSELFGGDLSEGDAIILNPPSNINLTSRRAWEIKHMAEHVIDTRDLTQSL